MVGKRSFTMPYGLRNYGPLFCPLSQERALYFMQYRSLPCHSTSDRVAPGATRASPVCQARRPPGVNHCHTSDLSGTKWVCSRRSSLLARGSRVPRVPSSPVFWLVTLLSCQQVCSCPSPFAALGGSVHTRCHPSDPGRCGHPCPHGSVSCHQLGVDITCSQCSSLDCRTPR